MAAYRLTRGDFQARFDPLGRLTHLGHPDHIRDRPTVFYTSGPIREGQWSVNFGNRDITFDHESARRTYDFDNARLTVEHSFRGPGAWYGLDLRCTYSIEESLLRCDFTLEHWAPEGERVVSAAPLRRLRYVTGVNAWTDYSSEWAHRPYPTNLRCEQDFFWAAAVSPAHDVVGYFSATKADSWHVLYEGHGSQRIRSFAIDFVNALDMHPTRWQHQEIVLGTDRRSYSGTFYAGMFGSLDSFFQQAADSLGVAFLVPERCAGFLGETLHMPVVAPQDGRTVTAQISDEVSGQSTTVVVPVRQLQVPLEGQSGRSIITLHAGGHTTEARVWRQRGWAETLQVAARHAADIRRASGFNAETILGLITVAQAAGLLGDAHCSAQAHAILTEAYADGHFDPVTGRQCSHHRLQNYGSFLDAVRCYHGYLGSDEWLEPAQNSARQLLSLQRSDGNFYNHHSIYNNVIHPVKSLFDWGEHLRAHGRTSEADEIHNAVERAYRSIARAGDDSQTEGSDHFEDGMTACCAYQIAALWPHFGRNPEDLAMAEAIYQRRRALKARVPDSRYFGATLRHWEGYWAMGLGQGMLGGHGWNAWSASLAHALFMATGAWHYLIDAYATVANCLQSVDTATGEFYFGFAIDPYWRDFFGLGGQYPGEEYVRMPDAVRNACEAHSVFYTLSHSFYHQTYVRVGADGCQVLNGRVLSEAPGMVEVESYALALREVVVAVDDPALPVPQVNVLGQTPEITLIGKVPL